MTMDVLGKIKALQKGKENTAVWMVGQQLADICKADPGCAALVLADLANPAMGLEACEQKIKEYADKHHGKSRSYCVAPNVAEQIIRDFYGLPSASDPAPAPEATPSDSPDGLLDLASFF